MAEEGLPFADALKQAQERGRRTGLAIIGFSLLAIAVGLLTLVFILVQSQLSAQNARLLARRKARAAEKTEAAPAQADTLPASQRAGPASPRTADLRISSLASRRAPDNSSAWRPSPRSSSSG